MELQNLERLKRTLTQLATKYLDSPNKGRESVIVGYTANYALHVHENLEAAHGAAYNAKYADEIARGRTKSGRKRRGWKGKTDRGPNQQAKFLEQPARELSSSGELSRIVSTAVRNGAKLPDALVLAGEAIQRASQLIVPVDTGNLRGSAFTRKE